MFKSIQNHEGTRGSQKDENPGAVWSRVLQTKCVIPVSRSPSAFSIRFLLQSQTRSWLDKSLDAETGRETVSTFTQWLSKSLENMVHRRDWKSFIVYLSYDGLGTTLPSLNSTNTLRLPQTVCWKRSWTMQKSEFRWFWERALTDHPWLILKQQMCVLSKGFKHFIKNKLQALAEDTSSPTWSLDAIQGSSIRRF